MMTSGSDDVRIDPRWLDQMARFMRAGSVSADMLRKSGNVPEHVIQAVIAAAANQKERDNGQEKRS